MDGEFACSSSSSPLREFVRNNSLTLPLILPNYGPKKRVCVREPQVRLGRKEVTGESTHACIIILVSISDPDSGLRLSFPQKGRDDVFLSRIWHSFLPLIDTRVSPSSLTPHFLLVVRSLHSLLVIDILLSCLLCSTQIQTQDIGMSGTRERESRGRGHMHPLIGLSQHVSSCFSFPGIRSKTSFHLILSSLASLGGRGKESE